MTVHIDPKIADLTLAAAAPMIEKGVKKITDKLQKTDSKISEDFEISGRETTIYCLEKTQKYSLLLDIKRNHIFKHYLEFRTGSVKRCSLLSLNGLQKIDAVTLNEQGFSINMKMLAEGEKYLLDIEYYLEDNGFIDALVERKRPKDIPGTDSTNYWMVAMLKYPDALNNSYGRMELFDIDFLVNVGIEQDLDTTVPKIFRQQLEQLAKVAGPLGRDELLKEYLRLRQLKTKEYGKESLDLLGKLQTLFLPQNFATYVDVQQDFKYSSVERGINQFDVPLSWPRSMNVISRTDLSLKKPTSKGVLVYKKDQFLEEVANIFD